MRLRPTRRVGLRRIGRLPWSLGGRGGVGSRLLFLLALSRSCRAPGGGHGRSSRRSAPGRRRGRPTSRIASARCAATRASASAVLACVAVAAGVAWFRAGHRAVGRGAAPAGRELRVVGGTTATSTPVDLECHHDHHERRDRRRRRRRGARAGRRQPARERTRHRRDPRRRRRDARRRSRAAQPRGQAGRRHARSRYRSSAQPPPAVDPERGERRRRSVATGDRPAVRPAAPRAPINVNTATADRARGAARASGRRSPPRSCRNASATVRSAASTISTACPASATGGSRSSAIS